MGSNKYKSARQGFYSPINKEKWTHDKIFFRSNIENKYFSYFDMNPAVLKIASEKVVIPYFDHVKNKNRRYYVDLIVKYVDKNKEEKVKLIEIKCSNEVRPPKKPKRETNAYRSSLATYITNCAKWEAAKRYAASKNWEFCVLTELSFR